MMKYYIHRIAKSVPSPWYRTAIARYAETNDWPKYLAILAAELTAFHARTLASQTANARRLSINNGGNIG